MELTKEQVFKIAWALCSQTYFQHIDSDGKATESMLIFHFYQDEVSAMRQNRNGWYEFRFPLSECKLVELNGLQRSNLEVLGCPEWQLKQRGILID